MGTRSDIVSQFKTDLEDHLNVENGYSSSLGEVVLGIVTPSNFNYTPAISYFCYNDNIREPLADSGFVRMMNFYVYGMVDISLNNVEPIYNLADDLEEFLLSNHWTYADNTLLSEEGINILMPAGDVTRAYLDFTFGVWYQQDLS